MICWRVLTFEGFEGILDALGVDALVTVLLPESAGSFAVDTDIVVLTGEAAFEQFGAELAAQTGVDIEGLNDHHSRCFCEFGHHGFIHNVERGLVDEACVDALFLEGDDCIQCPVKRITETHHIAGGTFADDIILADFEGIVITEKQVTVVLEYREPHCGWRRQNADPDHQRPW